MAKLGVTLVVMGILSFLIEYLDREFILFFWIHLWGPAVANWIRLGIIAGGVFLFLLGLWLDEQ